MLVNQVRDAARQNARLPAAGAGKYEKRALTMDDRFVLLRIQTLQIWRSFPDYAP